MNRTSEEQKVYYKEHPEQYQKHLKFMRKYSHTKAGKESRDSARKVFMEKHPDYFKDYAIDQRIWRKQVGLCVACGRNKAESGYVECKKCRRRARKYRAASKQP